MSQTRKQVPLRLSAKLYEQLSRWAQDDFRSLNGQIEYLLSEAVKKRTGKAEQGMSAASGPADTASEPHNPDKAKP